MADTQWTGFLPKNSLLMKRKAPRADKTAPHPSLVEIPAPENDSLAVISKELDGCPRCKLCKGRNTVVVGSGNPHAELMFVGEAPGEQEDLEGRPFVGRSGQLLEKMILAMGLTRDQVFITNVVKCRPPENRNPEPDEIAACSPFLFRQLAIIKPKVVVALGKFAAQTLLQTETPISQLRGQFHAYQPPGFPAGGAKLMPTFHPAYLLRNPPAKKDAWEDLKLVAKELGLKLPPQATGAKT